MLITAERDGCFGPARQLLSIDFYIVSGINGQAAMKQNSTDTGSQRILSTEVKQFIMQLLLVAF